MFKKILRSTPVSSLLLIRLLAGWVFLSEGIQKFIFSDDLGVGRFAKIGIPIPGISAPFVGCVEIFGGICLILGLLTRPAAALLVINMMVAILSTKLPILLNNGFWKMVHEARTDFSMLFSCLFLLIHGGGAGSLDQKWFARRFGDSA